MEWGSVPSYPATSTLLPSLPSILPLMWFSEASTSWHHVWLLLWQLPTQPWGISQAAGPLSSLIPPLIHSVLLTQLHRPPPGSWTCLMHPPPPPLFRTEWASLSHPVFLIQTRQHQLDHGASSELGKARLCTITQQRSSLLSVTFSVFVFHSYRYRIFVLILLWSDCLAQGQMYTRCNCPI